MRLCRMGVPKTATPKIAGQLGVGVIARASRAVLGVQPGHSTACLLTPATGQSMRATNRSGSSATRTTSSLPTSGCCLPFRSSSVRRLGGWRAGPLASRHGAPGTGSRALLRGTPIP